MLARVRSSPAIQKGTRVLISLWDSGGYQVPGTRVPFCIATGHMEVNAAGEEDWVPGSVSNQSRVRYAGADLG